jgi:hypothetical protein
LAAKGRFKGEAGLEVGDVDIDAAGGNTAGAEEAETLLLFM